MQEKSKTPFAASLFLSVGATLVLVAGCARTAPKGWSALRAGKLSEADRIVQKGLAEDPDSEELWDLRLRIDLIRREWKEAERSFNRFVALISAAERRAAIGLLVAQTVWAALNEKDTTVRRQGAKLARDLRIWGLGGSLEKKLDDPDPLVRAYVAGALFPHRFVGLLHLMELARHPDWRVRNQVALGLAQRPGGDRPFELLGRLASDRHPAVRAGALRAIGRSRREKGERFSEAVEMLVGGLSDPAGQVRAEAASQLARLGRKVGWAWIERSSKDPELAVRLAAVRGGKKRGMPVEEYRKLAEGKDIYVALRASVALFEKGEEEVACRVLSRAWRDPRWSVRAAALNAASSMKNSKSAVALIEKGLSADHPRVRLSAARGALNVGRLEGRAVEVLRKEADGARQVAVAAAHVLARHGKKQGAKRLGELAKSGDIDTRIHALRALGDLRKERDAVLSAWSKGPWFVRLGAAAVLSKRFARGSGRRKR